MSRLAEQIADELAAKAIEHIEKTGDEDIVTLLSKAMGDSSQTLQEAFITSVRIQRAGIRARAQLIDRAATLEGKEPPSKAKSEPTSEPVQKTLAKGPWDLEDNE